MVRFRGTVLDLVKCVSHAMLFPSDCAPLDVTLRLDFTDRDLLERRYSCTATAEKEIAREVKEEPCHIGAGAQIDGGDRQGENL